MTTKSMIYDNPAYIARQMIAIPANAAGASTTYGKFVAFAALQVFSLSLYENVAGTSTYTAWNGTATVTATGDTVTAYKVTGAVGSLTTSTYGPYAVNAGLGGYNRVQIPQGTDGGVAMLQGDAMYLLRGTDATAVTIPTYEVGITPGAAISN